MKQHMRNVCTLSRHGPTAAHDPSHDVLVQIDSYYNGDPTKQMVNACINHSMLSMLELNTACGNAWIHYICGQCMDPTKHMVNAWIHYICGQCMDPTQHMVNAWIHYICGQCMDPTIL